MITTSAEYKASIAQRFHRRTEGKVIIDFSDPFTDTSITVTPSSIGNMSYINQTNDGIEDPTHNWFPLDGSALLDGSFKLAPQSTDSNLENVYEVGWWGADVSDGSANFTSPQTITVTFSDRAVDSVKVIGDSIKGEYPVDFTIKLYNAAGTLLHTETVTGNTAVKYTASITPVLAVAKEVLAITKWSHAGRCAKVIEFFTSIKVTHMSNEIFEIDLLEESEVANGSLPVGNISSNSLTVRVLNIDRLYDAGNTASQLYNLIKPNRKVQAYIGAAGVSGVTEYIPLGVFWTGNWNVPDDDVYVEVQALDIINLMGREANYIPGLLTSQTLYEIIEDALLDFGVNVAMYDIDTDLSSVTVPYAYIEQKSHREVIRLAAAAGLARVYADRDGVITVHGIGWLAANSATSVRTIGADEYFKRKNPSRFDDLKNVVQVKTQPLVADGSSSTVYSKADVVVPASSSLTVTALYSEKPVISASAALVSPPAGVAISGTPTYYAWGASVVIANSNGTPQTCQLDVTGTVLRVTGSEIVESSDAASVAEFGRLVYEFPDNPFVQTHDQAKAIADALVSAYATAYRDITEEWRGDPAIVPDDRVTTDDSRTTTADYWIVRQQLKWDGALSVTFDGRKAT